jgi:hypothetical protein
VYNVLAKRFDSLSSKVEKVRRRDSSTVLPDDDSAPQTDRFPGSEPAAANVSARIWWLRSRRARSLRAGTTASLKLFRLVAGLAGDVGWRSEDEILHLVHKLPLATRKVRKLFNAQSTSATRSGTQLLRAETMPTSSPGTSRDISTTEGKAGVFNTTTSRLRQPMEAALVELGGLVA